MEGIYLLRDTLLQGDWMVKLDLKDAYLSVHIVAQSRNLLHFRWGLLVISLAIVSSLVIHQAALSSSGLPVHGVRLIIYLDNMLLMTQSPDTLQEHIQWAIDLFHRLFPYQLGEIRDPLSYRHRILEFLGFSMDSRAATFSPPASKLQTICKEIRRDLLRQQISIRQFARIIGLLTASIQAIFPIPLHYRALQRLKIAHLREGASYADWITLDPEAKDELQW